MTNSPRVLVIDDEPQILRAMRTILTAKQFDVVTASRGEEGLALAAANPPDVIVLDLSLPDMDGIEVCARLREWTQVPIIVLSVREHETDKIAALDAGADDYLTKPFGVGELLARIRTAVRHAARSTDEPIFTLGELNVDLARRLVTVAGAEVQLTPTEYDLLRLLVNDAGKVLTHHQLLRQVWGPGYDEELHMLRVNISNLRRKIEPDPSRPHYLLTEPGVGYRIRV